MGKSLYSFFLLDDKSRWRAFLWSWVLGTALGIVGVFAGASTQTLATLTLSASFSSFGGFLIVYVSREKRSVSTERREFMDLAYAGIATVLFAGVQRIFRSPEVVHAASIKAIEAVKANQVVSSSYLATIDSRVESLLNKGGEQQAMRRELLADHARVKAARLVLENSKAAHPYPSPSSPLVEAQSFDPPSPASMIQVPLGVKPSVVFEGFIYSTNSQANSLVGGGGDPSGLVFLHVIVKTFSQRLDRITWIDVRFEKCLIEYDGGPLILVDVLFVDCTFRIVENAPASLRSAITESIAPVTFSSDYPV